MEFVYANADTLVLWQRTGARVALRRGDVWWADDQFVADRPDLFSTTPIVVHGTAGQASPEPTPVEVKRGRKAASRG